MQKRGARKFGATIACLIETRQEGIYGQVCYYQDESEGATDLRGDETVFKVKDFTEWYVRDSERVDDKGAEGTAMFNG